ncbi:MAG TPA: hypothetical protein VEQ61_11200 [Thermoleophilaceae bacterium]|nr:hypothetical protein [Thermoleophilaceae bacterium]
MSATNVRDRLRELADLSLEFLPAMFDARKGLFSQKTIVRDGRYMNREPNLLYSTVSLVGLLMQQRRAADTLLPLGRAMDGVHEEARGNTSGAVLGNLVWASALAGDSRGAQALSELAQLDPERQHAGQLGQALHGLVTGAEAYPSGRERAERAARAVASEIERRFRPRGDGFRLSPTSGGRARSRVFYGVGSFAGQVYPLHGLGALHRRTGEPLPACAVRVANRIVEAQGPLGQWWWIYSLRARRVLEGYPVYSVHQDGMAFLGLVPMEELGAGSYVGALSKGLDWLYGKNELGRSMVERDPAFIPRCIQRSGSGADLPFGLSYPRYALMIGRAQVPWVGSDGNKPAPQRLEVLHECRSYHLGWLLYAHALMERLSGSTAG